MSETFPSLLNNKTKYRLGKIIHYLDAYHNQRGWAASYTEIAGEFKITINQVKYALQKLHQAGYIVHEGSRQISVKAFL